MCIGRFFQPSQNKNASAIPREKTAIYNLQNNKVISINDNQNLPKREIGSIQVGVEKTIPMQVDMHINSLLTSGAGIILRDSVISANQSVALISIKKQNKGFFNDTITISSDTYSFSFILSGEAY